MTDKEFIDSMCAYDSMLDHDPELCGMCYKQKIFADVAKEISATGNYVNAISRWSDEVEKIWQDGKFFKLWQVEKAAGRDPNDAFIAKGWEA